MIQRKIDPALLRLEDLERQMLEQVDELEQMEAQVHPFFDCNWSIFHFLTFFLIYEFKAASEEATF